MAEKHVIKEGSREHVVWWDTDGAHCSNSDCEMNEAPAPREEYGNKN